MKRKPFIMLDKEKLYSDEIQNLSDAQFRLLTVLRSLAGWDQRQTSNFRVIRKSMSEIKTGYLKNWEKSKISRITRQLISLKILTRLGPARLKLNDVPKLVQTVPILEKGVPRLGQSDINRKLDIIKKDLKNKGILEEDEFDDQLIDI